MMKCTGKNRHPAGLRGMGAILFILFFFLSVPAAPVSAYDADMHYNFTYWMAKKIGFSDTDALLIAMSNQQTDDSGLTTPLGMNPTNWVLNNTKRRYWHFPGKLTENWLGMQTYYDTAENNEYGRYNIVRAEGFDGAGDAKINPYFFGMSLHSYMDTFSHASFGGRYGHVRVGHKPDWPKENKEKTQRMANHVFTHFIDFARAGSLVNEQTLQTAIAAKATLVNTVLDIVDSYPSGDNVYLGNDSEINDRIKKWESTSPSLSISSAKSSGLWNTDTWKEKSYDLYGIPWEVSDGDVTLSGLDNTVMAASLPGTDETQDIEPSELDYCDIADGTLTLTEDERDAVLLDLLIENSGFLTDPGSYPDTLAAELDCAMELAGTKDALEVLMSFVDSQESGYTDEARVFMAMTLFNEVSWSDSDLEAVLIPYLDSEHDDTKLLTAWAAHMLNLPNTQAKVASIFSDALAQQLSNTCADGDCGEDFNLIHILPQALDFLDIWETFFTQGTAEQAQMAAAALYNMAIDEAGAAVSLNSLAASGSQPSNYAADDLLENDSPVNPSGWDQIDYWMVRAMEDIDDSMANSLEDQESIAGLVPVITEALQEDNLNKLQAAAIAASTYKQEDLVDPELIDALVSALGIDHTETKKQVALALESITGHSYDLSKIGMQTLDQQVQNSLNTQPVPVGQTTLMLETDEDIASAPVQIDVDNNGKIALSYALPAYIAPVDVYAGFYSPQGDFYLANASDAIGTDVVPFKTGTTGNISGVLDTAPFDLENGLWEIYWLVLPQGGDGSIYLLGYYKTTVN